MKKTRMIAAAFAAVMAMTTMASIGASAMLIDEMPGKNAVVCESKDQKTPSLFDQIQKWIEEQTKPKQQENKGPEKPWLPGMDRIKLEKYLKKNYNMDIKKLMTVLCDVRIYKRYNKSRDEIAREIRIQMQSVRNRNMTPAWNEDMIRFMTDFWDQLDAL